MIKDADYRPLTIAGKIHNSNYKNDFFKVVKNKAKTNKEEAKKNLVQVLDCDNLDKFSPNFPVYLFENENLPEQIFNHLKNKLYFTKVKNIDTLINEDIIEILVDSKKIKIIFRANSNDNFLKVINKCNSNCIFCPESRESRKKDNSLSINQLKKIIKMIPFSTKHLCLTGGEPTLLKTNLLNILEECKKNLYDTNFLLLTNGRMFFYNDYAKEFVNKRPAKTIIAVAIYAANEMKHDYLTSAKGSFKQTIKGLENLYKLGEKIEIRIVVNKKNYKDLKAISDLIIRKFPRIYRVNFMALEMLGNSIKNKKEVWVDFNLVREEIKKASLELIKNGIQTYIYNFPLCCIDRQLWQITAKSISDYKVRYLAECKKCDLKERCGGLFVSTAKVIDDIKLKAIKN